MFREARANQRAKAEFLRYLSDDEREMVKEHSILPIWLGSDKEQYRERCYYRPDYQYRFHGCAPSPYVGFLNLRAPQNENEVLYGWCPQHESFWRFNFGLTYAAYIPYSRWDEALGCLLLARRETPGWERYCSLSLAMEDDCWFERYVGHVPVEILRDYASANTR